MKQKKETALSPFFQLPNSSLKCWFGSRSELLNPSPPSSKVLIFLFCQIPGTFHPLEPAKKTPKMSKFSLRCSLIVVNKLNTLTLSCRHYTSLRIPSLPFNLAYICVRSWWSAFCKILNHIMTEWMHLLHYQTFTRKTRSLTLFWSLIEDTFTLISSHSFLLRALPTVSVTVTADCVGLCWYSETNEVQLSARLICHN